MTQDARRAKHTFNSTMAIIAVGAAFALLAWGVRGNNAVVSMAAGGLLALAIAYAGTVFLFSSNQGAEATERTLRVASSALSYMHEGMTQEGCNAVCRLLLAETSASGMAMTDTERVLACLGEGSEAYPVGTDNSAPTTKVLTSGRVETFVAKRSSGGLQARHWELGEEDTYAEELGEFYGGIVVPLVVRGKSVGTLKFYYRDTSQVDRTQLAIARGLGDLISMQLSVYELDRQAELTAQAEVKALQAQINPHFLFNTLNTIASFTRTDPNKARVLLREFSFFYRQTLEGSQSLIPLERELEQTRRYLMFEQARFGEDRIVESERVEEGCEQVQVPSFLVQPIVENAVRHAMREEGPLHIDLSVRSDGDDLLITVTDDGLGMDESRARLLLGETPTDAGQDGKRGTGIALRNVAERVEKFYGFGSGVEIVSRVDEGTSVTVRLANVAPKGTVVTVDDEGIEAED